MEFKDHIERKKFSLNQKNLQLPSSIGIEHNQEISQSNVYDQILSPIVNTTKNLAKEITFHTALETNEALIHLLENFPTPNCLDTFYTLLERWGGDIKTKKNVAEKKLRPLFLRGGPGVGKTTLVQAVDTLIFGKETTKPNGEKVNPSMLYWSAVDKDLNWLVVTQIFTNNGENLLQQIEEGYNSERFHPQTREYIRQNFPSDHFDDETGTVCFSDKKGVAPLYAKEGLIHHIEAISKIEGLRPDPKASLLDQIETGYNKKQFSPHTLKFIRNHFPHNHFNDKTQTVSLNEPYTKTELYRDEGLIPHIEKIAKIEGLQTNNTIGIKKVPGPLFYCAGLYGPEHARLLIVDEGDKALSASGGELNAPMSAMYGHAAPFLFKSADGAIQTFIHPKLIHPNFDLLFMGNTSRDTIEPSHFNESLRNRWTELYIHTAGLDDMTLRGCQTILGFNPWPILCAKEKDQKILIERIKLTYEKIGRPLNQTQIEYLDRLPNIVQGWRQYSACLLLNAKIQKEQLESGDDPILIQNANTLPQNNVRELVEQSNQSKFYTEYETTQESYLTLPSSHNEWEEAFRDNSTETAYVELTNGEKLQRVYLQTYTKNYPAGPETTAHFVANAILCGILAEPEEENNDNPNRLPLITAHFDSPKENLEIQPETHSLHKSLTELLLKENPDLKETELEKIIPLLELQKQINDLKTNKNTKCIVGLNNDYLQEKHGAHALRLIPVTEIPPSQNVHPDLLMETQEIEALLKHPTLKDQMLQNLWEHNPEANPDLEAFEGGESLNGKDPVVRMTNILSKHTNAKNKTRKDSTLLFHSTQKNQAIAYNSNFQKDTELEHLLITNSLKKASEKIRETWNQDEEIHKLKTCFLYYQTNLQDCEGPEDNPSNEHASQAEEILSKLYAEPYEDAVNRFLKEYKTYNNPFVQKCPYKEKKEDIENQKPTQTNIPAFS